MHEETSQSKHKKEVGSQTPGEKSFWNWKLLLIEYDFQMTVVFFYYKNYCKRQATVCVPCPLCVVIETGS